MMRVVAVVGVVGLAMVEGGIISSSTLQMCEKREDGENVDTTCEEKMVRTHDTAHRNRTRRGSGHGAACGGAARSTGRCCCRVCLCGFL